MTKDHRSSSPGPVLCRVSGYEIRLAQIETEPALTEHATATVEREDAQPVVKETIERSSDETEIDTIFAMTAAYFESRAKHSRSPEDQTHLFETAMFYRSLAQIVPALPPGYTANTTPTAELSDHWKARAEECRTLADRFHDTTCRQRLLRLAEDYERMAGGPE